MIIADSSIWIDHLRSSNRRLDELMERWEIFCHPCVIGELACGNMSGRKERLQFLKELPQATVASHAEVLRFIERHRLMGRGVGYTDMQLLASAAIQPGLLWTRDRRLNDAAQSLGLSY